MTETTITTPSWVQALDKYVASKPIEDVAADLGLKPEEIIMLVANENPNGMSSKVKEAVATAALNLNRYPDADAYHLQKAIAEKYGVPQDWVVIGSGSSELFGRRDRFVRRYNGDLSAVFFLAVSDGCSLVRSRDD